MTEWAAYERFAGPIGDGYLHEVLAALHEQIQLLNRMQGAAHFTDKKHRKNPAREPKHYPRPHEWYVQRDSPDDDEDESPDGGETFGEE